MGKVVTFAMISNRKLEKSEIQWGESCILEAWDMYMPPKTQKKDEKTKCFIFNGRKKAIFAWFIETSTVGNEPS